MAEVQILQFLADICQQLLANSTISTDNNQNIKQLLDSSAGRQILREMKTDFKNRQYLSVFLTSPDRLAIYVANYVASRALCYHQLLTTKLHLVNLLTGKDQIARAELERRRKQRRTGQPCPVDYASATRKVRVACIGAGAGSELIALLFSIELNIIDIADWAVLQKLIAQQAANDGRLSGVDIKWRQADILQLDDEELSHISQCDLITLMFVLNELFAVSKADTVRMLTRLINGMQKGAMLLLLESAGSFSELQVNQQNYMVYQLLDKIPRLELVEPAQDSIWYRYDPQLAANTLMPLNNMRYFLRIYRKSN
jgi:25S rRNA (uracil2843-N3)-methyltransferase